MKFGIDIDGTITSSDYLHEEIQKAFNIKFGLSDIVTYQLSDCLDIDEAKLQNWYDAHEDRLCGIAPLQEHVQEILASWAGEHELHFISARRDLVLPTTKNWFCEKEIPYHNIELLGSHDKVATAKKLGIDLFFEDNLNNALAINEECQIPVILFDYPYNRKPLPKNVIRVHNWLEAKTWVNNWVLLKK